MTVEFGSDTRLDETARPVRLASWLLDQWLWLLPQSDDFGIGFDRQKLRLSIHGESEDAGDAYDRGQVVGLLGVLNAMLGIVPLMLLGELVDVIPEAVAPVLLLPIIAAAVFGVVNVRGSFELTDKLQIFDPTTPETDTADLDAVKQEFLNGEITEAEFDRRVDAALEAETEARLE